MYDRNPHQVQFLSHTEQRRRTPLVLIHDGGGTTFSYFILGNLHRDVWAIHNPKFFTAELWEGGMDEMARHYISLLQKAGISGTIFLGGNLDIPIYCTHILISANRLVSRWSTLSSYFSQACRRQVLRNFCCWPYSG
jgi:hypothetical protein